MQNHVSQSVMLNLYSEGAQFESWPDTEQSSQIYVLLNQSFQKSTTN